MSFETRKKVTAPRQDITGSPDIYHRGIWIFHISAGEFCDAAQEALLSLQRQAVIVFSQAMGKNTTIARI
ncbi:MAG: hypothetical protein C4B57_11185, partial [Deltaproteobacteria bacterium]